MNNDPGVLSPQPLRPHFRAVELPLGGALHAPQLGYQLAERIADVG